LSEEVLINIAIDSTEAEMDMSILQGKIDQQVREWRMQRQVIVSQLHDLSRGIGLLIRGIRLVAEATGQTLDPMQNALLGLVSSTTSLIISTAIALTVGSLGLLTGVALAMSAFAYGMEIAHTIKLLADFAALRATIDGVKTRLTNLEIARTFTAQFGVGF